MSDRKDSDKKRENPGERMTRSNDEIRSKMAKLIQDAELHKNRVPYDKATAEERLKDPRNMATWIRKTASAQVRDLIVGWSVIFSIDIFSDGSTHHHGSAMLYPKGRSSTEEDWVNLGKIVASSGAPADVPMPFGMSDNANAPQHWFWYTETSAAPEPAKPYLCKSE